ncbi:MAG: glutamate 5-kinase [Chloroflexi bacterium]|nr:glutamate 5-kinase [Chloroflexota bacterium]
MAAKRAGTKARETQNKQGGRRERRAYRRIVAKFGTSLLTAGTDRLDLKMMSALVGQVAGLRSRGIEVIVVTSGAIAAGRHRLDAIGERPGGGVSARKDIPFRQVLAAVGQSHLMETYGRLFRKHDLVIAQTLLTRRDLADRVGYLNTRNTLLALLEFGVVPIVNENDVVAVEEIEGALIGDNDNLSALVANLIDADLLTLLTDTGGLHTADPRREPDAELVPLVERITPEIERLADDTATPHGVGGMVTKLEAAKLATAGGTDVVIANGHEPEVLERLATGEALGTRFPATTDRLESRKRWMLAGLATRGKIVVDAGAAKALRSQGRSLLPAGVSDVAGRFERGDSVSIWAEGGPRIALGVTNYGRDDVAAIRGVRSDRIAEVLGHEYGAEVVHRNNLVLL